MQVLWPLLPSCNGEGDGARTITLDAGQRYQTFVGWEANADAGDTGEPAFRAYRDALIERAVDEMGITRLRLEIRSGVENDRDHWTRWRTGEIDYATWRSLRYATKNDDDDPRRVEPGGFHFSELDHLVREIVLPMRARLMRDAQTLHVNLCYVAFTKQIGDGAYHHDDPEEYAEFVLATLVHLGDTFELVPDTWEVLLEPDNVAQWDGKRMGRAIVAAARRLEESGTTLRFVAPSTTSMRAAATYFEGLASIAGALEHVSELSYHRYADANLDNLAALVSLAQRAGIGTSMLEHLGSDPANLHRDLGLGRNVSWSGAYALAGADWRHDLYRIDKRKPEPRLFLNRHARVYGQYTRHIRPGATRIAATCAAMGVDALAFQHPTGGTVVVMRATPGPIVLRGLPPGRYGVTYVGNTGRASTQGARPDFEQSPGEEARVGLPHEGVMTIFRR